MAIIRSADLGDRMVRAYVGTNDARPDADFPAEIVKRMLQDHYDTTHAVATNA